MRIVITNRLVGWLLLIAISIPVLYAPWIGVINGKQPLFYKPIPQDYSAWSGFNENYRTDLENWYKYYPYADRTEGQVFLSVLRGIEVTTIPAALFIYLLSMAIGLIRGRKAKYKFSKEINLDWPSSRFDEFV